MTAPYDFETASQPIIQQVCSAYYYYHYYFSALEV